jgi:hypothetical protein
LSGDLLVTLGETIVPWMINIDGDKEPASLWTILAGQIDMKKLSLLFYI